MIEITFAKFIVSSFILFGIWVTVLLFLNTLGIVKLVD